jgi:hypothetical protein
MTVASKTCCSNVHCTLAVLSVVAVSSERSHVTQEPGLGWGGQSADSGTLVVHDQPAEVLG